MNETHPVSRKRGWTLERVLLFSAVALQVVILGWMYRDRLQRNREPTTPFEAAVYAEASRPRLPTVRSPTPNATPFDWCMARMDRMMRDSFERMRRMQTLFGTDDGWQSLGRMPAMNLRDVGEAYEIQMPLPEHATADLDVRAEGDRLSIGFSSETTEANRASSRTFQSQIKLPGRADTDRPVAAHITNRTLYVRVPKKQAL